MAGDVSKVIPLPKEIFAQDVMELRLIHHREFQARPQRSPLP